MAASPAASRRQSTNSSRRSGELPGGAGAGARSHRPSYDHGRAPFSSDVYGRQLSSYSARSSQVSRSGSFKAAAQRVAGAFTSCFVPRVKVKTEEEEEVKSRGTECHVSIDSVGSWQEGRALIIADVSRATSNFSEKNIVKQGGSSTMYKGKLKGGSQIAVKCVRKLNGQYLTAELWRELETLQSIEHQNLARFLGFFERDSDSLIVLEYVSNGSLREHLDESCGNGLELAQRLNIAIDVAHAITYLHVYKENPIIHGGIRSSVVLLTDALAVKVTGFGLLGMAASASGSGTGSGSDATPAKGAAGYVDPEYLTTYQLTDKSDVYSFGVERSHQMGVAEMQRRGSGGGHGPKDAAEPGVGGGGGEDAGAGGAVRRGGEEGPAGDAAVRRGAVGHPKGLPPPGRAAMRRHGGRSDRRVGCSGSSLVRIVCQTGAVVLE